MEKDTEDSPLLISQVSDKAASVLLLHDISNITSALHFYLSEMYFSPQHVSFLLLYSIGTAIMDLTVFP